MEILRVERVCPPAPRMTAAMSWGCLFLVWLLFGAVSLASPAEGSLRLSKTPSTVLLTWDEGEGPYGIYRSPDPADLFRPAWLVGGTADLSYEEPISAGFGNISFYFVDSLLPCTSDADCDNHLVCDGVEICNTVEFQCHAGIAVECNDGSACTLDTCDDTTGGCHYEPVGCDDGDSCTIDTCRHSSGCYHEVDPAAGVGIATEIAGRSLSEFPHFEFTRSFNEGTGIEAGIDPFAHPAVVGQNCDLYLLEARSAGQWCVDTSLSDVRGTPETVSLSSTDIQANTFLLANSATLSSDAGTTIGAGYDLVLDCDQDGFLDSGELADGLADEAGFHVVHDLTTSGPLLVSQFDDIGPEPPHCNSSGNDDMRIYYPQDLDEPTFEGVFPLVVISHGNGHCYDWYDFLGTHLASYGYIVMSHDNNTSPGIETASTTTLEFTDKILLNQDTLNGGVLNGHIDSARIAWIGHSRGGEGVVRAYDRMVDEGYVNSAYGPDDIVVISSIAPTDFLGPEEADPHSVPYHLLYGSADGDVCGCPGNSITQSFGLLERATGPRQSTYVHGADHNDFNCCGFNDFAGPADTQIGRPEAQQVQKAATLALLKHYLEGQPAPRDYLWRQYEALRAIGIDSATVVVSELREGPGQRTHVIDDYQTHPDLLTSSSGAAVSSDVSNLVEQQQREPNSAYTWDPADPMNGMARGRPEDVGQGSVFDYSAGSNRQYDFSVLEIQRDFTDDEFLSFRACQGTRHPETIAVLEDLTFTVTLVDGAGRESSIHIGAYGGGIEEPYQRTGYGTGAGWQNEFETIRIRLTDFLRNGADLDLTNIHNVRFDFGAAYGSAEGRIGLDDLELTKE